MELNDVKMYQYLQDKDSSLANQVKDVYYLTIETINSISKSFSNYTMHDMNHGLRVASYMEQLAFGINGDFDKRISEFNAFEITLMLLSSILHDIGMTIRKEDTEEIKIAETIKYTKSLTYNGVLKVCNNDEEEAIKEIIRRTHAARIEDFMFYEFGTNKTKIHDRLAIEGKYYYSDDVITICKAHGEDYSFLKEIRPSSTKGKYSYNPRYIAALLRIADYLDIDQQRTPMLWYSSMGINGFSKEEWEKHFVIQNTAKLKKYMNNKLQIYFDGRSSNAKIHRKYLAYIDELKQELENADNLLNTTVTPDKYIFNISTKIDDSVHTEGFTYSDLRLNLDYSSITNLLMGKNIYGDRRLGLRELVQNSVDACRLMKESNAEVNDVFYMEPAIDISCSKANNYVKIRDTGIGMTWDVVRKHFLNVGKSYYKSDDFKYKNSEYVPIGQYGIGFLACFLLSDNVTVKTKYYNQFEVIQIELEKNSEYVVTTSQATPNFFGTEITLDYDKFMETFGGFDEVESFLKLYFNTEIDITLTNIDELKRIKIKNQEIERIEETLNNDDINFLSINLSTVSEKLTGNVFLSYKNNLNAIKLRDLSDEEEINYYYNKSEDLLIKVDDLSIFNGKYRFMEYPSISEDRIQDIFDKNEAFSNAYNEAKAFAKEGNKLINIIIDPNDYNLFYIDFFERDNENTKRLEDIFDRSKIVFHKDLFMYRTIIRPTFIYRSMCAELSIADFDDRGFYYRRNHMYDMSDALLYYKGIYVPRINDVYLYSPYDISNIVGVINCDSISLKLDVSRNSIIEGEKEINKEFNKSLLNFFSENVAQSESEKAFLNAIILEITND